MTTNWNTLTDEAQRRVLGHCNAGFGIATDASEGWTIKLGRKLIEVDPTDLEASYPDGGDYDTAIFESEAEFTARRFGLHEISANAGLSGTIEGVTGGLSGEMTETDETETEQASKTTTYYLYSEYVVRKVKLRMRAEITDLDPGFEAALRTALSGGSAMQRLTAVYGVLNERGWYVPAAMTLGGRLMQSETVRTDRSTDRAKIVTAFEASMKGNVGVPGLFDAEGGGGGKTRHEAETETALYQSATGKHLTFRGGSQQALQEAGLSDWLASLEDPESWQVIAMELMPTLACVPSDLLDDIRKLYRQYGAKAEAKRHANVDAFLYFGEVETSSPGLVSEWG